MSAVEGKKIILSGGQLQGEALHILKVQDMISDIFKLLMPEDHTLIADDRVIGYDPQSCRGILVCDLQSFGFCCGCGDRRQGGDLRFPVCYF